jgi:hypothetical protein
MYTDTASSLKGMSSMVSLKALSIGVVNTENTVRAYEYISNPGNNPFRESAATYQPKVEESLDETLRNRFQSVGYYNSPIDALKAGVDLILAFDFQARLAGFAIPTTVKVTGTFADRNLKTIDTVQGSGSETLTGWGFFVPLNSAFNEFRGKIDQSSALRNYASTLVRSKPESKPVTAAIKKPITPPSTMDASLLSFQKQDLKKQVLPSTNRGQSWAVIIGISQYKYAGQNGLTNLIFADDDAKAFTRVLRNLGWSESHIKVLINEKATKRNIEIALESWLTKANPNDQIVLFWAGHGFPNPEDPEMVYFACYDTEISIPATGFRMDKVRAALEERKARNVVVLADTCHAGKLITRGERGISIVPQIDKMHREQNTPKGWIFMVGADTDRKAVEHTSWTNGAFTHCLLDALSGKADGYLSSGEKDGVVTAGELRAYMNTAMPDETQRVLGVAKRPLITTSSGDPEIWNLTFQAK